MADQTLRLPKFSKFPSCECVEVCEFIVVYCNTPKVQPSGAASGEESV